MKKISYIIYLVLVNVAYHLGPISFLISKNKNNVRKNLTVVLERKPTIKEMILTFSFYNVYWAEFFFLTTNLSSKVILQPGNFLLSNSNQYDLSGKILALPHIGGWEMAGHYLSQSGYKMLAIAEELDSEKMTKWCSYTRRNRGIDIVYHNDKKLISKCVDHLKNGGVLCVVNDRNIGSASSTSNQLFKQDVNLPSGAAIIALRAKTDILCVSVPMIKKGFIFTHICNIGNEVSTSYDEKLSTKIIKINSMLAEFIEEQITQFPFQWHCLENYFHLKESL